MNYHIVCLNDGNNEDEYVLLGEKGLTTFDAFTLVEFLSRPHACNYIVHYFFLEQYDNEVEPTDPMYERTVYAFDRLYRVHDNTDRLYEFALICGYCMNKEGEEEK